MLIMTSGGVVVLLFAICCKAGRCALIVASSACNADMVSLWSIAASTSTDTLDSMADFSIPSFDNVPRSLLLRRIDLPKKIEVAPSAICDRFLFPIDGIIGEVRMVVEVGDGNSHHSVISNCFLEVCGCRLTLL